MRLISLSYVLPLVALLATACSEDDSWKPGEPDTSAVGAFFKSLPSYNITMEADDSHVITASVGRLNKDDAVTVPITLVSSPQGVTVPQSVSFAAGQETAQFEIDCTDMPSKTSGTIEIKIDPGYATIYGAGSTTLAVNVNIAGSWILLAENVKVTFDDSKYVYDEETTEIYMLDGMNRYKIPNFLNSGLDLVFTTEFTDPEYNYPDIIPLKNMIWYTEVWPDDEDLYRCWYLYDQANDEFPVWSPDGTGPQITYFMVYGMGYSYISLTTTDGFGYIYASTDYEDGTWGDTNVNLEFNTLFDPATRIE